MDINDARARIHAMVPTATDEDVAELDRRINDLISTVQYDAAAVVSECCAIRLRRKAVASSAQQ